jgi:uncharacterized membrane protein YczE
VFLTLPRDRFVERLVRCISGLFMFGLGISMFLAAKVGMAPWDVFHQGVSRHTGISVGIVIEITGVFILLLWLPLRERLGLGTLLNAFEIGFVVWLISDRLPHPHSLWVRVPMMLVGLVAIAIGSGLYIGAGLGPGPRDGLMLGLAKRGISVRVARTGVEAAVLVCGVVMGGSVGLGTVAFTLGIGPLVQFFLPRLQLHPA